MRFLKFLLFVSILLVSTFTSAQDTLLVDADKPQIDLLRFDKYSFELGKVKVGDVVKFDIPFKNVSQEVVVIDFISSCDCTEVDFSKDDILPGQKSVMHVTFDSSGKKESETTDIEIFLKNKDKETNSPIYFTIEYSFEI